MALAMSKAAPLRPDIKLSQALKDYEAVLTEDQRKSFHDESPLAFNDVMVLTCEIDRQNASRKSRRWGARLTTFLNSVKGFTAIVDGAVGNTGNPMAGAVWGAVKTAMQVASTFESYFDALSTMLMNVGQSAPRYEKYAILYPASASLRQELCNYFSVVIDFCKAAVLFVRKPVIFQALDALRKPFNDEFGKFQKDLVRFCDAVRDEVSLAAKQQQNLERKENSLFRRTGALFQHEVARQLEENKKWRELRFMSRFLNSCSTYNHETALNQARRKGASSWIFETKEYTSWQSSISSSIMLCSGIVGAGKTVLSSSVVEELVVTRAADTSVGYFFCKDDDFQSLKAREIMGSLARQFLSAVPVKLFNQLDQDVGDIALSIEQIVTLMLRLLPLNNHYILAVDGLDECQPEEAYQLLDTFQTLVRSPAHVFKLFWTGRSDFVERVSYRLQSDFHVKISPSKNGPEISRFIERALDEALENGRLQLRDPRIIVRIQEALEKEAYEMFLWVTFQIDSICRENSDEGILNALEDLPKDLPTTYRRILRRLRDSGSTDPLTGKKIFELIAAARRPLTLEELREAISVEPGDTHWSAAKLVNDVMKSLDCCGSLIVVGEEPSTVHFAHSSVKQHLETSPGNLDIPEYHISLREANHSMGKIIVTYLNLDVLQGQLTEPRKSPQTSTTQDASLLIGAGLPHSTIVSSLARKLLKNRRIPGYDVGRDLEKAAGFTREPKVRPQHANSFLSYAREHWLSHTEFLGRKSLIKRENWRYYELWARLVDGDVRTVELPWTSEDARTMSPHFLEFISHHSSLIFRVYEKSRTQGEEGVYGIEKFLKRFLYGGDGEYKPDFLDAVIEDNLAALGLP